MAARTAPYGCCQDGRIWCERCRQWFPNRAAYHRHVDQGCAPKVEASK